MPSRAKKGLTLAAVASIAALGAQVMTLTGAANAQTVSSQAFSAFATGSVVHTDALQAAVAGPRVADAEEAFSGAAANSSSLGTALVNEMSQGISPALATKNTYGRGSGLEVGLGTSTPNDPNANQIILSGQAEASAAPTTPLVTKEVGPVKADPIAYASLLRGQAAAAWDPNTCVIGQPLSYGLGYAADAQLLDTSSANTDGTFKAPLVAADTTQNARAVSQSRSFTYLKPNNDAAGTWGVVSEVHETIAPVTLFKGTVNEVTIEALGEWVLRATSTGSGSTITYAPGGSVTPTTPVLRILQPNGSPAVTTILTLQQLLGNTGLQIPANPLVNISIGEGPRAIAKPGAIPDPKAPPVKTATQAAAAVDVVRVSLLQPDATGGFHALDLRIGHMEASATAPAGGLQCHIPVNKTVTPNPVQAGQPFTWTITVPTSAADFAAIDCDLTNITVVDTIADGQGSSATWAIDSEAPPGVVSNGGSTITWSGLSYKRGDPPITLTIHGHIPASSPAGLITDTANVTATLANCNGGAAGSDIVGQIAKITGTGSTATNSVAQPINGTFTVQGPQVNAGGSGGGQSNLPSGELPHTGGHPYTPIGLGLLVTGLVGYGWRRRLTAARG
jgi:hypothetical protein